MNISQEQKNKLKISSISEHEIDFKLGFKKLEIYNYKDGDFSIRLEDGNDVVEVILNDEQIEVIKRFLYNDISYSL
jgi:DNA polymerase II small subunit/DNA polymerase delta subunit B